MQLSSIQMLLLAAVAITSVPRSALGQAAPENCTDANAGKQFCSNCNAPSKCGLAGSAPAPLPVCKAGQACIVLLGKYAVCKPIAETPCGCGTKSAKCDPYDPHSRIVCLSGGITTTEKCSAPADTCIDDKCATAPPQTTTVSPASLCLNGETGFVAVTPECTTAAFCDNNTSLGTTEPCGAGKYYDVDELECLPSPPLPCPVACGTGACNDKGNCSKWYVCDAGTILAEETCEGSTPEFDTTTSECVVEGNGTCSKNNGCNFNLITTSATTTTTSSSATTTTTSSSATTTTTKTGSTLSTTSSTTKITIPGSTTTSKIDTAPPTTSSTTTSTRTSTTPPTTSRTTTSTKTSTTPPTSSTTSSSSSSTTSTSSPTNRPSTCGATNVGIRYPIEGNCKKYTSCRLLSTNVYGYVESSCLGSLVFNAKTGYCDTLANVPGCVPPA